MKKITLPLHQILHLSSCGPEPLLAVNEKMDESDVRNKYVPAREWACYLSKNNGMEIITIYKTESYRIEAEASVFMDEWDYIIHTIHPDINIQDIKYLRNEETNEITHACAYYRKRKGY